jgi:hypothetical protein
MLDWEPISEIEGDDAIYWHIIYTPDNWRHTVELMLPDEIMVEIYKDCGLHIIDCCGHQLTMTDSEILEDIILTSDIDFEPLIKRIHELRKDKFWAKLLKAI